MDHKKTFARLLKTIDDRAPKMTRIKKYWENASPVTFLSKESRAALDGKIDKLGVNFTRVVVNSHTERETVRSFTRPGAEKPDSALWERWLAAGMEDKAELVHTDRALYGLAYVTVWGALGNALRPVVMLDTPFTAATLEDPSTGDTWAGLRTWQDGDTRHAVMWTDGDVFKWTTSGAGSGAGELLASNWTLTSHEINDLDMVPMVPFIRQESIGDTGTSVAADVFDISDALAKLLSDAMVTSEDYAKPRRFATGLEIEEDEDGNVVDPFGRGRNLQSEAPETKFGQLAGSTVDTYTGLIATLTQLVGMLTGLPPHYLGLHGDQPANADSVKAAEAQLISRVGNEIKKLLRPWGRVMSLIEAVATGADPHSLAISTTFEAPELKTPNQASDAAVKLKALGIPLRTLLSNPLEFSQTEVDTIMDQYEAEQIKAAAFNMGSSIPTATV